jgi:hypothetical protein
MSDGEVAVRGDEVQSMPMMKGVSREEVTIEPDGTHTGPAVKRIDIDTDEVTVYCPCGHYVARLDPTELVLQRHSHLRGITAGVPTMSDTEPAIQRVFPVNPDTNRERKCAICGYRVVSRYLLAANESHAQAKREEMADNPDANGMCGDCLAGYIANDGFRLTRDDDHRHRAAGISLPAMGFEVNGDLPPAGEQYSHDAFEPGMEECPVGNCEGELTRVEVVSERADGGEPSNHIDTLEVSCRSCQRVLYKAESVAYDRLEQ